jgi:DeoR/GlpR family transcriptional regulator of sugar metabolism
MSNMLKSERQDEILNEVHRSKVATIADLAGRLNVSEITVRRDLDELARAGQLERVRGGARERSPRGPESPVIQRQMSQVEEKLAIGEAALDLISDGDVIAVESGSTVLQLVRCLSRRNWTQLEVVTNSFPIVEELIHVPGIRLVFVGGLVQPDELATFGVLAQDMLKNMHVNKLFIGCRGIDPRIGLMNDLQAQLEVETMRAMAESAEQVIVLADHTKFGQHFMLRTLPISSVDVIVADDLVAEAILDELHKQDIQVVIAQTSLFESESRA